MRLSAATAALSILRRSMLTASTSKPRCNTPISCYPIHLRQKSTMPAQQPRNRAGLSAKANNKFSNTGQRSTDPSPSAVARSAMVTLGVTGAVAGAARLPCYYMVNSTRGRKQQLQLEVRQVQRGNVAPGTICIIAKTRTAEIQQTGWQLQQRETDLLQHARSSSGQLLQNQRWHWLLRENASCWPGAAPSGASPRALPPTLRPRNCSVRPLANISIRRPRRAICTQSRE